MSANNKPKSLVCKHAYDLISVNIQKSIWKFSKFDHPWNFATLLKRQNGCQLFMAQAKSLPTEAKKTQNKTKKLLINFLSFRLYSYFSKLMTNPSASFFFFTSKSGIIFVFSCIIEIRLLVTL